MRKLLALFLMSLYAGAAGAAPGGYQIKKAAAVEVQEQGAMEAATGQNLVGTALSLVSGVMALKKSEQELSESCAPKSGDVEHVNKMVREYAKIGAQTADKMLESLEAKDKQPGDGGKDCFRDTVGVDGLNLCYPVYGDKDVIWKGYPVAVSLKKCPPKKPNCASKDEKYYSNAYEIYDQMNWSAADLLKDETSAHAQLEKKIEECSPAVLKRKKQELTGNLITSTLGGIGQKQGTGNTMGQVSGMMGAMGGGGGGAMGAIGGIGSLATGMMPGLMGGQ
ncbi:MAG: hypothetical protein LBL21_03000 [Rickettsiales bacterium]|nr:hypothetical protein [Rickettsiales bacterium]